VTQRLSLWSELAAARRSFESAPDTFGPALTLTLLLVLLYPPSLALVRAPIMVLALGALIVPRLRHQPRLWLAITALVLAGCVQRWLVIDNHKMLLVYWCLALVLATHAQAPAVSLAHSARQLIAAVFAIATFSKVMSRDFLSADFFAWSLLTDERMRPLTHLLAIPPAVSRANAVAEAALRSFDSVREAVTLTVPPGTLMLARGMTAWTILIEGLIAIAFAWPQGRGISKLRDPILLSSLRRRTAWLP
jgi:hypothetical protein